HNALLLDELQHKNRQLEAYAAQVETLAVVEERNRLAREMHDMRRKMRTDPRLHALRPGGPPCRHRWLILSSSSGMDRCWW
ncbi:MAG TPA: hypothetical protein VLR45_08050, partial [Desulfoprunum sp.]|nr:hypothetical protein [Desulfoprunum sp.]